jgi:flavodoxin
MKILIAYYSRAGKNYASGELVDLSVGNTEIAANRIRELSGGELFRIETLKPYPEAYHDATEAARMEKDRNARPRLSAKAEGMGSYTHVVLGYPNWWGTMPMALFTFLESYDFSGKAIAPFCTNEGSGLGHSEEDIARLCPRSTLLRGLSITGSEVRESEPVIADWLKKCGLIP